MALKSLDLQELFLNPAFTDDQNGFESVDDQNDSVEPRLFTGLFKILSTFRV